MKIEDNLKQFDSTVQNLDDEQMIRLNAKLESGSRRYVEIEILNGNIQTFSQLNSTATLIEDAKRKAGEASDNIYNIKECIQLVATRVAIAERNLTRLTNIFSGYFNFGPYREKVLNTPEEVKQVAQDFKEKYETHYGSLRGKAVITQDQGEWEINFHSDGIEIKKVVVEQAVEKEKPPEEQNPLHSFLAFGDNLKWSEEKGLEIDPSGTNEKTVKALHQALFSKSPIQIDDLCEDFLEKVHDISHGKEANEISAYIHRQWLQGYLLDHQEDKEAATQFVEATTKITKRYGRQKFVKSLEAFLKMTHLADDSLKPALITFSEYIVENEDNRLTSALEKKSPILNSCLKRIAEQKDTHILDEWLRCYDKQTSFSTLQRFSKKLPDEWLLEKLQAYSDELGPPENVLKTLRNSSNFTEFYYFYKIGEPYQEETWEKRFPCKAQGNRYTVQKLSNVGYGDQNNYGALFHQTLQIGHACLVEKNWDFPQLLALLMLKRNRIAQIQQKHGLRLWYQENCGNLNLGESVFTTPCTDPYHELGEDLLSSLAEWENWKGFVKKTDEHTYQLQGTLNSKTFEHSFIRIDSGHVTIHHTKDPKTRREILHEVGELFKQARQEKSQEAFMKKIGLIYYWICQAKPFELGDPSIAEMVIRILCMERGVELPSWREDTIPWAEVMKHFNPDEFANKFHSLFSYS